MNKEKRCQLANELITVIATCGREFFNYDGKLNYRQQDGFVSHFKLKKGRVYFVDGYIQKDIYAYSNLYFRGKFSQGGTMQALILDLAEFIRTGKATNAKNGYGGVYCSHWGYPEDDMEIVRKKAVEIGFSKGLDTDIYRFDYIN